MDFGMGKHKYTLAPNGQIMIFLRNKQKSWFFCYELAYKIDNKAIPGMNLSIINCLLMSRFLFQMIDT